MDTKEIIESLESVIGDPTAGLPDEVFLFVSKITPLVNVDLLIKDQQGRALLTWRDDGIIPPGWHIPGGIIRYKETAFARIEAVARLELGARVEFNKDPAAINEVILPTKRIRGHFISFLYECRLLTPPDERLKYRQGTPKPGEWAWHEGCPEDLVQVHQIYRAFLAGNNKPMRL